MVIYHDKGKVISISEKETEVSEDDLDLMVNKESSSITVQELSIELKTGQNKGGIIKIENELHNDPFDIIVKKGDKVLLYGMAPPGETEINYSLQDKWHFDGIILAVLIFMGLVLLLGGKKGIQALVSLALSILAIFYIFIPLLKKDVNSVFITFIIVIAISIITMPIILGFNRKSLVAIFGATLGVITALFFGFLFKWLIDINGMGAEDSRMLAVQFPDFDYEGIFLAGVIIGALGAVMDVAVSITSGLEEVTRHSKSLSIQEIWSSGLSIGRDILGSMVNTLIFAYVGASLTLILLFMQSNASLIDVLNQGFIAEEVVRSLVGSIGLLATIPLTALFGAYFFKDGASRRTRGGINKAIYR